MLDRCSRDLCDLAPPATVILLTQNRDRDRLKWGSLALKKRRCTNLTAMEAIACAATEDRRSLPQKSKSCLKLRKELGKWRGDRREDLTPQTTDPRRPLAPRLAIARSWPLPVRGNLPLSYSSPCDRALNRTIPKFPSLSHKPLSIGLDG